MANDRIDAHGANLRAAVLSRFQALSDNGQLNPGIGGTDIGAIVEPQLAKGIPFAEAEAILRSAGFTVRARPGPEAGRNPNRAKDWDAVLAVMELPTGHALARSTAYISLHPTVAHNYGIVASLTAAIRTSHP